MAFTDTLRKVATVIGLYGKESEAGYGDGRYEQGRYDRDSDPDDRGDYRDYPDDRDYENQSEDPYGDSYGTYTEDEPRYQTTYDTQDPYRRGARPSKEPPRQTQQRRAPQQESAPPPRPARQPQRPSNVVPMREEQRFASGRSAAREEPRAASRADNRHTTVFCARRKEDSEQIITYLVEGVTVVLNLEELDDVQYRRVLDMVSGAAFALGGSIIRTSQRGYLVAPEGTVIVDDQRDQREPRETRERERDSGYNARW